jgi:hypothetical protein
MVWLMDDMALSRYLPEGSQHHLEQYSSTACGLHERGNGTLKGRQYDARN